MSCTKISKTNKGESNLFKTIYEKVANENEQLATFYYNWFNSKEFINIFGFNYVDYYKKNIQNERLDDNGEPKLEYDESVKKYYFLDKNNEKTYFPHVHIGLSKTFDTIQIKNIVSRLTASYIKRNLGLNFNNIDFSKIKSLPKIENYILDEINKRTEYFKENGERGKSIIIKTLSKHIPELTELVVQHFKSLAIDVDEDSDFNEEESTREGLIGKASFERSSKSKVSTNVKLRLSLLTDSTKKDDIWEDNILMDFGEIYRKLQELLCNNIPLESEFLYDLYLNKIEEAKSSFPYLEDLYQMLIKNKNENFKYEFSQAFFLAKHSHTSEKYSQGENGLIQSTTDLSNSHDKLINVKDRFVNNFKTVLVNQENNKIKEEFLTFIDKIFDSLKNNFNKNSTLSNSDKIKAIEGYKNLLLENLNKLGISINEKSFRYYLDYPSDLNSISDVEKLKIYNKINHLNSQLINYFFKNLNDTSKSGIDLTKLFKTTDEINKLVKAQAFIENDMGDPNVRIGGEKRWMFGNPSHLHMELERWKKDPSILLNQYNNETYLKDASRWINKWFDLDNTELSYEKRIEIAKKNLEKVKIGTLGEIVYTRDSKDEFKKTTDLSFKDYLVNNINSVLKEQGFTRTITQADKATEYTFKNLIERLKGFVGYNRALGEYELSQEVKDTFFNYYLSELKRSIEAKNTILEAIKTKDYSKLVPHYHYNYKEFLKDPESIKKFTGNAFKSQYFDKLNNKDAKTNIEKEIVDFLYDSNGLIKVNDLNESTLNNSNLKENFESYLQTMITKEVSRNLKELTSLGIIKSTEKGYTNKLLDGDLFQKYISQAGPQGEHAAISKMVIDYVINGISNNIEFSKLFTGDIAYYKDSVDFKKRIPATYTDGKYLILKPGEEKFRIATIQAVVKNNPFKAALEKLLGKGIDAHTLDILTDVNDTDAQAWITPERWKFLKQRLGDWSPLHDEVYRKMQSDKDEEYTKDELKVAAQPLKGVYFYKINGQPTYLKYSQAVLTKSLVKGTDLERMLNKMYESEIDELITFDGVKVGSITPTKIHDENGNLLLDDEIKFNVQELNNHGWKLQQDLPTKLYKNTDVGSQIQKNILAGLKFYLDKDNFFYKGENRTGQYILDELVKIIGNLSDDGYKRLIQKSGIDETGKIKYVKKFYKALIDELKSRGGSENVIKALESETALYGIPQSTGKLFQIFASMINKNIIKIQTNGGSFIQMANFGINYETIQTGKTGIRLNPNIKGLNPPMLNIDENGNKTVTPGAIFISSSFIAKYIPNWKEYTDGELFVSYKGGHPIIDKRIQENIIGYRIPNQGLPSNDALQIAGILPESAGDTIIAYTGMTKKTGSDFDIDKMYIMFPHYEKIIDKKEEVFKKIEETLRGINNEETFQNYKSFLSKFEDVDNETLNNDFISEYNSLKEKEEKTEFLRIVRKELIDFILLNINSKPVKTTFKDIEFKVKGLKYSTRGITGEQNKLIEIYKSVLTNPDVYSDVMKSIDNDLIKNEINDLKPDVSDSFMSVVNPKDDIEKRYSFLGGKAGVGMEANAMTDIWRTGKIIISDLGKFIWGNYNKETKETELDMQYSEELSKEDLDYYVSQMIKPDSPKERVDAFKNEIRKIKIGETLGTILNAFVDIAKEPYITNGNWTTSTTNVGNLMLRMGVHPLYVTSFLANPIIAKYNRFQQNNEGLFDNTSGDMFNKFKHSIIKDYIGDEKKGGNPKFTALYDLYFKKLNINEDELQDEEIKAEYDKSKQAVLKALNNDESEFNKFIDISTKYFNDVFKPKSLNLFDRKTKQYNGEPLNLKTFRDVIKNENKTNLNFEITLLDEFRAIQSYSKSLKYIVEFGKLDTNGIGKDPNTIFYLESLLKDILENNFNDLDDDGNPVKGVIKGFDSKLDNTILSKYYNNLLKIKDILLNNPSFFPMSNESVREIVNQIVDSSTFDYSKKEDLTNKVFNQFKTYIYNKVFDIDNGNRELLIKNVPLYFQRFKSQNEGKYFILENLNINKKGELVLNNSEKSPEFQKLFTDSWEELFEKDANFAEALVKYSFIKSGFNSTISEFYSYIPFQYFIRKNINRHLKSIFENSNFADFENKFYLNHLTDTQFVKNVLPNNVTEIEGNENVRLLDYSKGSFITINNEYYKKIGLNNNEQFVYVKIKNESTKNNYNVELELHDYDENMINVEKELEQQPIEEFVETKQEVKSEIIDKTSIQMQPQNVEKILNGTKTTTIRESILKGGNIAINETKIVNFGGKDFYVTNRGHLTIQEAGGLENMLKSEGLNSIDDFMYNQSKNWAKGNGKMYVFDIKESFKEFNKPQQLSLFDNLQESKTMSKLKEMFNKGLMLDKFNELGINNIEDLNNKSEDELGELLKKICK